MVYRVRSWRSRIERLRCTTVLHGEEGKVLISVRKARSMVSARGEKYTFSTADIPHLVTDPNECYVYSQER